MMQPPTRAAGILLDPDYCLRKIHDRPPGGRRLQHAAIEIVRVTGTNPADKCFLFAIERFSAHEGVMHTALFFHTATEHSAV